MIRSHFSLGRSHSAEFSDNVDVEAIGDSDYAKLQQQSVSVLCDSRSITTADTEAIVDGEGGWVVASY